jgi:hypothetical protein
VSFENDDATVHIKPTDPWDKKRKLDGDVRDMTVWNFAMPADAIQSLWNGSEKE